MTKKFDERRSGRLPTGAPAPATEPLDQKLNAESEDKPRNRRTKGESEVSSNDPNIKLQARHNVIGAGLKRIFDEIVEEPIPPEFLELLDKIDLERER